MTQTSDIWLDKAPDVPFEPGILYRLLGNAGAVVLGIPALIMVPIFPFFGVPGLVMAVWVASWARRERAWVTAEGIWMRRLPAMKDEFVAWQRIDEVALPIGALRSPWLRVDGCARIRLPLFVGSDAFHDAVSIHRPDVLDRTCEWIVHTSAAAEAAGSKVSGSATRIERSGAHRATRLPSSPRDTTSSDPTRDASAVVGVAS